MFSCRLKIKTSSDLLFKAITCELDHWWTSSSNSISKIGECLEVQFESKTNWMMTVIEYELNKKLIWKVVGAYHDLTQLKKKDEWLNTQISWELIAQENETELIFKHFGLDEKLECYEICSNGWQYFLGSLKNYLETGKGTPYSE